jgi:hypothetical protein
LLVSQAPALPPSQAAKDFIWETVCIGIEVESPGEMGQCVNAFTGGIEGQSDIQIGVSEVVLDSQLVGLEPGVVFASIDKSVS